MLQFTPKSIRRFATRLTVMLFALYINPVSAIEEFKAAGCYVANENGVLVNENRLLNRLQLPIGKRDANETPKQTAERETLEETGLEVKADVLLVKLSDDKVFLFACTPVSADNRKLQPRDTVEVADVYWLNPHTLRNHRGEIVKTSWRFPQTLVLLKRLFSREQ